MNLQDAQGLAIEILTTAGIEDAHLESELLLRHTLNVGRVQLYLKSETGMDADRQAEFFKLVERRSKGEPSAYITGHREFYALDFIVDQNVLIPRPESEQLVKMALDIASKHPVKTIAEIGTGSGAIAISLAMHLPSVRIYASDVSADALGVAIANCRKHRVEDRVLLLKGNLLEPVPVSVDLIIANLPYIPESELDSVNTFGFEPRIALDGGADGLRLIRRLCGRIETKLNPGGSLLLEIGQGQAEALSDYLHRLFPNSSLTISPDLAGIPRVVLLKLNPRPVADLLDG